MANRLNTSMTNTLNTSGTNILNTSMTNTMKASMSLTGLTPNVEEGAKEGAPAASARRSPSATHA